MMKCTIHRIEPKYYTHTHKQNVINNNKDEKYKPKGDLTV